MTPEQERQLDALLECTTSLAKSLNVQNENIGLIIDRLDELEARLDNIESFASCVKDLSGKPFSCARVYS